MSREAWAEEIGAKLDEAGIPSPASIAAHIRAATAAEGHLTSHRIVRGLKESYAPFGAEDSDVHAAIHAVLDLLVDIGDLTRFSTSSGAAYVATPERLVDLGGDAFAVLGAITFPVAVETGLVRKVPKAAIQATNSVPILSLASETGLAAWRLHLVNLSGTDTAQGGPTALFTHLAGLAVSGERLERLGPADLRVVAGAGEYFGNGRAPNLEGRWKAWSGGEPRCGLRKRAYNWQACVVSENSQGLRVIDVTDTDCWRWAVIGQLQSAGEPVARRLGEIYQCLTPPPQQIRRLLALAGEPVGPWRWSVRPEAADLSDQFLGQA